MPLALGLLAAFNANAGSSPDFQGVSRGDTEEFVSATYPDARCEFEALQSGSRVCRVVDRVAGVSSDLSFVLESGLVRQIVVSVATDKFEQVSSHFRSRYGVEVTEQMTYGSSASERLAGFWEAPAILVTAPRELSTPDASETPAPAEIAQGTPVAQADSSEVKGKQGVPVVTFLVSGSQSSDIDYSQIFGAELQYNWRLGGGFALGFHGMFQNQEYGPVDTDRWGLGVSFNYYLPFDSVMPYIGIKRTYYGSAESDGEALDCLYCSDEDTDYEGGETFATAGLIIHRWTVQIDYRLTDEGSDWSSGGYDPWGVGPSWNDQYDGVPDPEMIFSLGYSW